MLITDVLKGSSLLATLGLVSGCCIGVSAGAQSAGGPQSNTQAVQSESQAASSGCPNGMQPAADGLLDDWEDGNTQLLVDGARDGYWWTHHDPNGSTIEPNPLAPEAGGPDGSTQTMRISGQTSSADGAYGSSLGVNFSTSGAYDASKYAGISFKAKAAGSSVKKVRFKIGDVNTHQDGAVCTDCWNHFGKDVTLTEEWQEYVIPFSELKQGDGWGDPRPQSLTPEKLYNLDWSIGPGATFELWIDDIQFHECK